MSTPEHQRARVVWAAWALSLVGAAAPLWVGRLLPLVDLPQHLYLIAALNGLDDPTTLYPETFAARAAFTPYLGYYYAVSLLHLALPLELANRLFLTGCVVGLPLALAFLLRALNRPTWPALLAAPFAYGDSFAWGFVNYCAALPLALVTAGLFVRALDDPPHRRRWAALLALGLLATLAFHVQAFAWLGVGLPWLLVTTPVPEGGGGSRRRLLARVPALCGVLPGVALFGVWLALRFGRPPEIAPGQHWKSWGPLLSPENLAYKSPLQNLADLVVVHGGEVRFPILAGITPDGTDRYAVLAVVGVACCVTLYGWLRPTPRDEPWPARLRIFGLAVLALALLFSLPFDIRGYMYYLNTRYAHLAAALLVASVPVTPPAWARGGPWVGVAVACVLAVPLGRAFRAFDVEAQALAEVSAAAADRPRVMGLVYAPYSQVVTHPVYLHAGTVVAREHGGIANFSFAGTPHSPLTYVGPPPPTFASEWRPDLFDWYAEGNAYDHFLIRGASAEAVFGPLLESELVVVARRGDFTLVRRR